MSDNKTITYTLDLNTQKMEESMADLNKEMKTLKENQKDLKDNGKDTSVAFVQNAEKMKKLKKSYSEYSKDLIKANKLKEKEGGHLDKLKLKLSLVTRQVNGLSKEELKNDKVGGKLVKQQKELTDELTKSEEAGGNFHREIGKYSKGMDEGSKSSKGFFGNLMSGIKSAGKAFLANPIGLIIAAIVLALVALKKAFTMSSGGPDIMAKGMGVLKGVLAFMLKGFQKLADVLIDAFNKPKEAWESFTKALSDGYEWIKKQVIDRISGSFDIMAGGLTKTFAKIRLAWAKIWDNKDDIVKAEKDISEANKRILDGQEKIAEANKILAKTYKEVNDAINNAAEAAFKEAKRLIKVGIAIEELKLKNERLGITYTTINAGLEKQLSLQEQIRDDATKSLAQREAAAAKAIAIQKELAANQLKLAKNDEIVLKKTQKMNSDASIETSKEIAEATAKRIEAEMNYQQTVYDGEKELNQLHSDIFEQKLDAEIDFTEKKRNLLIQQSTDVTIPLKARKKAIEDAAKLTEQAYGREIKMFETMSGKKIDVNKMLKLSDADQVAAYLKGLGLSEILSNRFLHEVLNEKLQINQDIKSADQTLSAWQIENQKKKATILLHKEKIVWANKLLLGEVSQTEYNDWQAKTEIEQFKKSEDFAVMSETEKQEAIKAIKLKYSNETAELTTEQQIQAAKAVANKSLSILSSLNSEMMAEANFRKDELIRIATETANSETQVAQDSFDTKDAALKDQLANGIISQEQYDKKLEALSIIRNNKEKDIKNKMINTENAAALKAFNANKSAQKNSVLMNMASSVMAAWNTTIPAPYGQILAGIETAVILGIGASQIGRIEKTKFTPKPLMAAGGLIAGPLHAAGGVNIGNINTEGGEYLSILNRASSEKYLPVLDKINSAGNKNGDVNEVNDIIDYEKLGAVLQSKKVYVVSTEVTDKQNQDIIVQERVSF